MILLDTDHLSVLLDPRHARQSKLLAKLESARQDIAIPIIAVEEQLRAWLAQIRRSTASTDLIAPYHRLAKLIDFLSDWSLAEWNERAARIFDDLRFQRVRIGTQDLRIAAIALAHDALLLSANLRDFKRVPRLRCEDWLHSVS